MHVGWATVVIHPLRVRNSAVGEHAPVQSGRRLIKKVSSGTVREPARPARVRTKREETEKEGRRQGGDREREGEREHGHVVLSLSPVATF